MKFAVACVAVVILAACRTAAPADRDAQAQVAGSLWLQLESEWEPAEPQTGFTAAASARLLRFYPDGRMAMLACLLLRSSEGTSISRGDGLVFYFGTWRSAGRDYVADYVKVRETVNWSKDGPPYSRKQTARVHRSASALNFDGQAFAPASVSTAKDFESVTHGIEDYEAVRIKEFFEQH